MSDKAVVSGEYVTYSHVKTRKTFTITIEFPEEKALEVLNILGAPVADNSNPVAVCLLDKKIHTDNHTADTPIVTEGEKLRTRAVMLCKDGWFYHYIMKYIPPYEDEKEYQRFVDDLCKLEKRGLSEQAAHTTLVIYRYCNISSRKELATNVDAQQLFKELLEDYNQWKTEQQYPDNFSR